MSLPLELIDITIAYGDHTVLSGVSLCLEAGEIGCFLGPSGCGKTSLLRAIAGFERPQQGQIKIAQTTVADRDQWVPPEQRKVGMVFQDFALFPHLSVSDNIAFGLSSWPRTEKNARVQQLLELVGLGDYANAYPHELSGGQQQRVALARALAPKPDILLLDEPFSSIDTELREQLAVQIRTALKAENTAAILVTHDQQEAFTIADRLGVIRHGALRQWDAARTVYQQPVDTVVAEFIGGGMFIRGELIADQIASTALGDIPVKMIPAETRLEAGSPVQVLIRPQQLDIERASTAQHQAKVSAITFRGAVSHYHFTLPGEASTLVCEVSNAQFAEECPLEQISVIFSGSSALAYPVENAAENEALNHS